MGALAAANNIALRTGCFCNPGSSIQFFTEILPQAPLLRPELWSRWSKDKPTDEIIGQFKDLGLVRISVGLPTNFEDCYRFIAFLKSAFLSNPDNIQQLADESIAGSDDSMC